MERSEDTRIAVKHFEDAEKAVEEYHGIPGDAAKMDVLAGPFKDAMNGTEVADAAVLREMTLFRRGGDLCLFDGIHMYVLPLGAACIRLVEQPIPLSSVSWNKSDKPAKKQYRQCGVVVRNDILEGLLFCCALELCHGGEEYRLLGAEHDWRVVIGFAGGIVVGIGLFNIVAAWMHQYFGHVVTLLCFLLGAAMMAVGWRCLL